MSNRIWGSRSADLPLTGALWLRKKKAQPGVCSRGTQLVLLSPTRQDQPVQISLGHGLPGWRQVRTSSLGRVTSPLLLNRLAVPQSFVFCSTPHDPKIRKQHGVRKGTELEIKRWRFESRAPLLHCVGWFTSSSAHCCNGNAEMSALCYPFWLSFINPKQRRKFLSPKSPRTEKLILYFFALFSQLYTNSKYIFIIQIYLSRPFNIYILFMFLFTSQIEYPFISTNISFLYRPCPYHSF